MQFDFKINNDGIIFLRGMEQDIHMPCLRKVRRKDWYWSSYRWWENIKEGLGINGVTLPEELLGFIQKDQKLIDLLGKRAILKTDLFDRIFKFPLWEGQKHAASVMAAAKRFYLGANVGLGKSLSAFATLALLKERNLIRNALIVSLASVKFQWKLEIERALKDEYQDTYSIKVIHGTKARREEDWAEPSFLKIVNYESLLRDEGIPFFDAIVLDDAFKVKNWRIKTTRRIRELAKDIPYRYVLNAAIVSNGYDELFGPFDIIDPTVFLCWGNFRDNYIIIEDKKVWRKERDQKGRVVPRLKIIRNQKVGYKNISDLQERMKPVLLRQTTKDMGWKEPQITVTPYWVDLTDEQWKRYLEIKNSDANALEKIVRARVACLFTQSTPVEKTPKYRELLQILEEIAVTEKVLIFSESRRYLSMVEDALKDAGQHVAFIHGGVDAKQRTHLQGEFTDGSIRILLLTAAGEAGMNLQASDLVINLDIPWNPERLRQRIGRLRPHLGGEARHIRVLNIFASDTIEERVIQKVHEKLKYFALLFSEEVENITGLFDSKELVKLL